MSDRKTDKLPELDYFNAISCLLVILIHVLGYAITNLDPASWQYALVFIPHQLSAYVVPGFLFVGGVKMALSFSRDARYLPYILRRTLKVYVPYLFWNVIYYLCLLGIGYVSGDFPKELLRYIWDGTLSAQFYYVLIVMQFYFLMPLWRWLTRKVPWYAGVFLSLFVTVLMTRADLVLEHLGLSFSAWGTTFPAFLVYWVTGLYVGANYPRVRKALTAHRAAVLSVSAVTFCFLFIVWLSRAKQIWIYDLNITKIFSDLASIAVLLCLCLMLSSSRLRLTKSLLVKIHAASLSVFLTHPLFLTLATHHLQLRGVTSVEAVTLVRALVCYTVPFLLFWLMHRAPGLLKSLFTRSRPAA